MQRRRSLDDLQRSYAAFLRLRQLTEWTSRSRRLLAGKSSAKAAVGLSRSIGQECFGNLPFLVATRRQLLYSAKSNNRSTSSAAGHPCRGLTAGNRADVQFSSNHQQLRESKLYVSALLATEMYQSKTSRWRCLSWLKGGVPQRFLCRGNF